MFKCQVYIFKYHNFLFLRLFGARKLLLKSLLFCWVLLGIEVSNWAGKALMRRNTGQAKPPPPVRRSSSVTTSVNGGMEKTQSQRVSKPPVLSPKPKLSAPNDGRGSSRISTSSMSNEPFPSPPPIHQDDEGMLVFSLFCYILIIT